MYFYYFIFLFISFFYNGNQIVDLHYSPTTCTIVNYDFTFLFDNDEERFKVHGLWPETCSECNDCGYPSCCNIDLINYIYPYDPTNFIQNNWFYSLTNEDCTNKKNIILFEHEYYKHISCTNIKTTTEFLNLIIFLYNNYYDKYVNNNCNGYKQIYLHLNSNFEYNGTSCI
jgi:hypothetical protein